MKKFNFLITVFLLFILKINNAYSLVEVDITRGNLDPLPIAVSPLSLEKKDEIELKKINDQILALENINLELDNLGSKISELIENNLKKTGLFDTLSKDAFLQKPDIAHLKPRFEDWTLIKAQALITGKVSVQNEKLTVEFRLWDVLSAKEMRKV